jgi:glutamine amidotransferase
MKISVIDYGTGNVNSVVNMLTWIGVECSVINTPSDVKKADKIILPGIGSFDNGIHLLEAGDWKDELNEFVLVKQNYILGICLGMQLMCNSSAEGSKLGLSWIDGEVNKFNSDEFEIKIPHMGWNNLNLLESSSLFSLSDLEYRFYFVHSYYVMLNNLKFETSNVNYGVRFTSSFEYNNILGVQFHPEKSHKYGMRLLSDFAKI